jgi:biopolymer transport protein TolR
MGMSSSGNNGGAMADINVTPLVDVMLVLLIIFMVTAPMMNSAGVQIDLPRTDAAPLPNQQDQLILSIDKELRYYIGDKVFAGPELQAELTQRAIAKPDQPVFLRADGDVPYKEVAAVLGIAKAAGMPRVGLVFEPGVPTPAAPRK